MKFKKEKKYYCLKNEKKLFGFYYLIKSIK